MTENLKKIELTESEITYIMDLLLEKQAIIVKAIGNMEKAEEYLKLINKTQPFSLFKKFNV